MEQNFQSGYQDKLKHMKTIGIIDDKDSARKSFARQIKNVLERLYPDWEVIDRKPFMKKDDYPQWIIENEISVLILDQQLDGEAIENGKSVDYNGHNLVKELRFRFKDLPVYSITSYALSEELTANLSYFNLILSMRDFDEDTDNYINLFVKSGISFYNEFKKELSRLGELSRKIADGKYLREDLLEIQALQTRLIIPHFSDELLDREKNIEKLEELISDIKVHQENLIQYLNK